MGNSAAEASLGRARRGRTGSRTRTATADAAGLCQVACVDGAAVARARAAMPPAPAVALAAETLKVLGDPTRLRIVHALSREELCVCDLAALVGMSQSVVSHSLRALRQMRLVRYRKAGKVAYYSLDDAHVATLLTEALHHVGERP